MKLTIVLATTAAAALLAAAAHAQYAPHTGDMTPDAPNASKNPHSAAQADAAAAFNSPDSYGPSHPVTPRSANPANAGVGTNTTSGAGPSSRSAGKYGSDAATVAPDTSYGDTMHGPSGATSGAAPATNEPK